MINNTISHNTISYVCVMVLCVTLWCLYCYVCHVMYVKISCLYHVVCKLLKLHQANFFFKLHFRLWTSSSTAWLIGCQYCYIYLSLIVHVKGFHINKFFRYAHEAEVPSWWTFPTNKQTFKLLLCTQYTCTANQFGHFRGSSVF